MCQRSTAAAGNISESCGSRLVPRCDGANQTVAFIGCFFSAHASSVILRRKCTAFRAAPDGLASKTPKCNYVKIIIDCLELITNYLQLITNDLEIMADYICAISKYVF